MCSFGFRTSTLKSSTYSHQATTRLLHPHGHRFNICHALTANGLTPVCCRVSTRLFLFAPSSMSVGMGLLLRWASWFFKGLSCVENEGCRFSAPRSSRVFITSALNPIFHEICLTTGSSPPAIRGSISDNFSGGFCSWTGSRPPATYYRVPTILLGEYGFEPPR